MFKGKATKFLYCSLLLNIFGSRVSTKVTRLYIDNIIHMYNLVCRCNVYFKSKHGDYSRESSVTSILKELKWPTLQQRRTNTKMVMMYRIVHHLIAIPSQMYLTPATTRTTSDHDQKSQIPFLRIQSHQNTYLPSAIRTWNNLTAVLVSVPIREAFKVELADV